MEPWRHRGTAQARHISSFSSSTVTLGPKYCVPKLNSIIGRYKRRESSKEARFQILYQALLLIDSVHCLYTYLYSFGLRLLLLCCLPTTSLLLTHLTLRTCSYFVFSQYYILVTYSRTRSHFFLAMGPRVTAPYYSSGLRARFLTDGMRLDQRDADGGRSPPKYADIEYEIDEQKYLARSKARMAAGGLPTEVPPGWPQKLEGPLVWSSNDFPNEDEYVYTLTDDDKTELLYALHSFKSKFLPGAGRQLIRILLSAPGRRPPDPES